MNGPLDQFIILLIVWVLAALSGQRFNAPLLTLGGAAFVWIFSPVAVLVIVFSVLEAMALIKLLAGRPRSDNLRKYLPYLLLLNLFFVDLHPLVFGFNIQTLAISFSTIRIFMTAKHLLSDRRGIQSGDLGWVLVAAFYLPAVVIGPVFSGTLLRDQDRSNKPAVPCLRDHRMLLLGLVLSTLVAAGLSAIMIELEVGSKFGPAQVIFAFLNLFAGFWGQSLIAEHSSRFFGYDIPQNFDAPWRATNIREFWARWHRSMAQFVMQYIYFPLTLNKVPNRLATVLSFTFMGLWHNFSLGYAIWGISHGLLLAFWPTDSGEDQSWLGRRASQIFTWLAVFTLSYVANYANF